MAHTFGQSFLGAIVVDMKSDRSICVYELCENEKRELKKVPSLTSGQLQFRSSVYNKVSQVF